MSEELQDPLDKMRREPKLIQPDPGNISTRPAVVRAKITAKWDPPLFDPLTQCSDGQFHQWEPMDKWYGEKCARPGCASTRHPRQITLPIEKMTRQQFRLRYPEHPDAQPGDFREELDSRNRVEWKKLQEDERPLMPIPLHREPAREMVVQVADYENAMRAAIAAVTGWRLCAACFGVTTVVMCVAWWVK